MAPVPTEIREKILEFLYCICRQESRPTTVYASLCSSWQKLFEAKHFEMLEVTQERVADFGRIVVGDRRHLVRHIRTHIVFERGSAETYKHRVCAGVIKTLFSSLSTWDRTPGNDPGRLVLELSTNLKPFPLLGLHEPRWVEVPSPIPEAPLPSVPEVRAVTTLRLHRDTYNILRKHPRFLKLVLRSLRALGKLSYEYRGLIDPSLEPGSGEIYEVMFQSLPTSINDVVLFDKGIDAFYSAHSLFGFPVMDRSVNRRALGISLARASQQLQHFSASFVTDAIYFFQPFWPQASDSRAETAEDWTWNKLETLALTSKLLSRSHQSEEDINYLLEAVSLAVRRMPKLQTLEIWNGNGNEHACLFRYSYDSYSRRSSLTWKGTWEIDITQRTACSWNETVRQKTGVETAIRFEKLEFDPPLMIEAVALFLDLRDRVATDRALAFEDRLLRSKATVSLRVGD